MDRDTIAAIATAPGSGGIGVIRLSGPLARSIGEHTTGLTLRDRHAHYCQFRDKQGAILDSGIGLYFPAPNSFTGEDVVELQAHGGAVILDLILQTLFEQGARQARPGEFSLRAYLNDKLDLTQAEAIADLIDSTTKQAALNASRSLQGEFSREIDQLVQRVTTLRVFIEAAIDFPEEEIDFIGDSEVSAQLQSIIDQCEQVTAAARQGSLLREGMKLVIAGKPNAGKSSLLNILTGQDSAIVTAIEGTTRDVLREQIQLDGMPLHVVDTAGLRDSADEIEQEGIRRAWQEMASADHILLVVDGHALGARDVDDDDIWPEKRQHLPDHIPVTIVRNKSDLDHEAPRCYHFHGTTTIHLSAKTGAGVPLLKEHLKSSIGYEQATEGRFSARRRHLTALDEAREHLLAGQAQLLAAGAAELLAEDLRQCQQSLGEITGKVSSDELLGKIFSSFCIGK